ncbi:unnamed protein product [Schistosoma curassoni]|uniref:Ovule protein n=1 Tax=Schistosoma curassoni TaxID=6186 RepID=A0A183KJE1_9TREM|nr:unnamed protein product [Schistosoma curassoni]
MQNTSYPFTRHNQQQPAMQERTNQIPVEEEIKKKCWNWIGHTLRNVPNYVIKASPHMESSRPKEKRKTKEHITPRNGDRHEKNKQESDGTGKEGP